MNRNPERGVTLVEVVLALTISAGVVVILLMTMRLGHRSVEKGTEREDVSQHMRVLADRLGWLIRGAYPYIVKTGEGSLLYFAGTSESVGFVTTSTDAYSDAIQDRPGLKWITLFADKEGLKVREKLFFEDVFEAPPRDEFVLDPAVRSIEFEFYDPGDEEAESGAWVSGWDPEGYEYVPAAVRITLSFQSGEDIIEMPPLTISVRAGQKLSIKKEGT